MDYQKELLERTKNTKFYLPFLYNNLDYKTSDFSKICYLSSQNPFLLIDTESQKKELIHKLKYFCNNKTLLDFSIL